MTDSNKKHYAPSGKTLTLIWLLGCLHIIYQGFQPNTYPYARVSGHSSYPTDGVSMMCTWFTFYFIAQWFFRATGLHQNAPFWSYAGCSVILLIQFGLAIMAAMHAPPYISAYILNMEMLLIFHFIIWNIVNFMLPSE